MNSFVMAMYRRSNSCRNLKMLNVFDNKWQNAFSMVFLKWVGVLMLYFDGIIEHFINS